MDPNKTWETIDQLMASNNPDEAVPHIMALKEWIYHGGFVPMDFDENLFKCMLSWVKDGCLLARDCRII